MRMHTLSHNEVDGQFKGATRRRLGVDSMQPQQPGAIKSSHSPSLTQVEIWVKLRVTVWMRVRVRLRVGVGDREEDESGQEGENGEEGEHGEEVRRRGRGRGSGSGDESGDRRLGAGRSSNGEGSAPNRFLPITLPQDALADQRLPQCACSSLIAIAIHIAESGRWGRCRRPVQY